MHGRRNRRPELPPRQGPRHGQQRQRPGDQSPGPNVRSPEIRPGPALNNLRPRFLRATLLPLRRSARSGSRKNNQGDKRSPRSRRRKIARPRARITFVSRRPQPASERSKVRFCSYLSPRERTARLAPSPITSPRGLSPLPERRALHNPCIRTEKRRNFESRAKDARWIRTLTLILSLAGRGEDNARWLRTALLKGRGRALRNLGPFGFLMIRAKRSV